MKAWFLAGGRGGITCIVWDLCDKNFCLWSDCKKYFLVKMLLDLSNLRSKAKATLWTGGAGKIYFSLVVICATRKNTATTIFVKNCCSTWTGRTSTWTGSAGDIFPCCDLWLCGRHNFFVVVKTIAGECMSRKVHGVSAGLWPFLYQCDFDFTNDSCDNKICDNKLISLINRHLNCHCCESYCWILQR